MQKSKERNGLKTGEFITLLTRETIKKRYLRFHIKSSLEKKKKKRKKEK